MKPRTAKVFRVEDIPGGGPSDTGKSIALEFKLRGGQVLAFEFSRAVADKLVSAAQRCIFEARKIAGAAGHHDAASAAGALTFKSGEINFRSEADGSQAQLVIRGQAGPPISLVLLPEDFAALRANLDEVERKMSELRAKKQN
jgi:hypothetical protein